MLAGLSSQLEILFEKATLVSLPLTWTSAAHCSSALREEMPKAVRTHLPSSPQASAYDHNFDKVFYGEVRPAVVRSGTSWATVALTRNVFCCAPSGAMADVWIVWTLGHGQPGCDGELGRRCIRALGWRRQSFKAFVLLIHSGEACEAGFSSPKVWGKNDMHPI